MFNKYFTYCEDNSDKAARIVERGLENLGGTLQSISTEEIKARDRVDITLAEYERLKEDVRTYEARCKRMGELIIRLGIPAEVIDTIDLDSVTVETNDDHQIFKRWYRIMFSVDRWRR